MFSQFSALFHNFLRMPFVWDLSQLSNCLTGPSEVTNLCLFARFSDSACIRAVNIPSIFDMTEMLLFTEINLFHHVSHMGFRLFFFPPMFMSSTQTERNNTFLRCVNTHSDFELFPNRFYQDFFKLSFPQQSCWGVRADVFQLVPLDLEFCPMVSGGGIVVDESRLLGTLILVIPTTLACLPFLLECKPILHHMLILRILEVWKSDPELWRLSRVTRRIPAQ